MMNIIYFHKVIDEKTGTVIGLLAYTLSTLMTKPNLEESQQPYDLQGAGVDSKLIMSMILRILKYEEPEATSEDDEDDQNINELNKQIERQESSVSGSSGIN